LHSIYWQEVNFLAGKQACYSGVKTSERGPGR
jgi:hypothetical protein